ncbi:MAG: hypothetical protein ACPG7F_02050 [Aggregatilineales bacterium]
MLKHQFSKVSGAILLIALFALMALAPVLSQGEGSITIMGTLDSIAADSVTVDGIAYGLAEGTALPEITLLGQQVILSARPDATTGGILVLSISSATPATETPVPTIAPIADAPINIIIEGPVQQINVNIITIYDIDVVFDANAPLPTGLVIGDILSIEGTTTTSADTIIVAASTSTVLDVTTWQPDDGGVTLIGVLEGIGTDTIIIDGISFPALNGVLPDTSLVGQTVTLRSRPTTDLQSVVIITVLPDDDTQPTVAPPSPTTVNATVPPATATDVVPSPQPTIIQATVPPVPPTMTMTPVNDGSGDVIIVLEGPVQTINVNVVTIYNITIELAQNDPILVDIVTGDILRVVGRARFSGFNIVVFSVTTVNIVNVNYIFINPGVGGGIPSGCKVTKKGKIKCSKKSSKKSS